MMNGFFSKVKTDFLSQNRGLVTVFSILIMGYITKLMRIKNVGISPEFLGNDLDIEIRKKASSLITGTQTKHGLVISVEKFKIEDEGEIKFDNTGFTRYTVIVKVKMYVPILGETVKTTVKDVPSNGFYVDEPVDIFVVANTRTQKKVGDVVSITITKVTFNKGKFMVLAKEC